MINQLLSEESKIKRNRKTAIGIQATAISWILELLGGMTLLFSYALVKDREELVDLLTLLIFVGLYFILIPVSYLLIPEKYKLRILEHGWYKSFRIPNHKNKMDVSIRSVQSGLESINHVIVLLNLPSNGTIPSVSGIIAVKELNPSHKKSKKRSML